MSKDELEMLFTDEYVNKEFLMYMTGYSAQYAQKELKRISNIYKEKKYFAPRGKVAISWIAKEYGIKKEHVYNKFLKFNNSKENI